MLHSKGIDVGEIMWSRVCADVAGPAELGRAMQPRTPHCAGFDHVVAERAGRQWLALEARCHDCAVRFVDDAVDLHRYTVADNRLNGVRTLAGCRAKC